MKRLFYAALAAAVVMVAFPAPRSARAEEQLIFKPDGNRQVSPSLILGDGRFLDTELQTVINGFITSTVVLPQSKELDSLRIWLTMGNNPDYTPLYIEVWQGDFRIGTSTTQEVLERNSGIPGVYGFQFVNIPSRITLYAGLPYHFVLVGTGIGSGTMLTVQSDAAPPGGSSVYFELYGEDAPPPEPVILIPGFLGSTLNGVSGGHEAWPDISDLISSPSDTYLDALELAPDGTQIPGRELAAGNVIENESIGVPQLPLQEVFYGNLVKQFTGDGYIAGQNFFEVPYDWRLDIKSQVAALQAVVDRARAVSPDGKINIVAHSMGGLLAKQYLLTAGDTSFVNKVVMVGVPQLGAPIAYKVLNYGDNLGFTVPLINSDILNSGEVKSISQNMPSLYELLPSSRYVDVNGGYVKDFRHNGTTILSYPQTNAIMTADPNDSRNASLISSAQTFHDSLDEAATPGVQMYNIIGCENSNTLGEIRLYDDDRIDIGEVNGDGTVPLTSAMNLADGETNYFISSLQTGIDHLGLVKDSRSTALIKHIIEGVAPNLPDGMSTNLSICFPPPQTDFLSWLFSITSGHGLDLYDSEGDHTGLRPDGGVELGVPGSSYETLGDNTFISAPPGDTYQIVAHSDTKNSVSINARKLDGSTVVDQTNYEDVPLASSSSIISGKFEDNGSAPVLAIDDDGDGVTDSQRGFTAELGGEALGDVTPPQITISGVPSSTTVGAQLQITFSAVDDISGAPNVAGTLDDAPFQSGDILTVTTPGVHTVVVSDADNAGNPTTVTETFDVPYPQLPRETAVCTNNN